MVRMVRTFHCARNFLLIVCTHTVHTHTHIDVADVFVTIMVGIFWTILFHTLAAHTLFARAARVSRRCAKRVLGRRFLVAVLLVRCCRQRRRRRGAQISRLRFAIMNIVCASKYKPAGSHCAKRHVHGSLPFYTSPANCGARACCQKHST